VKLRLISILVLVFAVSLLAVSARADSFTKLAADNFAVLASSTVTNTGSTTISGSGNVGVSPGSAITDEAGISLGTGGAFYTTATSLAATGQTDATAVYGTLQGLSGTSLTGKDLGGLTLTPGVYTFASSAFLTGTLTLNFGGASNEAIVIDTGSTLITSSGSSVVLKGADSTDSVYWAVGSNATLGTDTSFMGNIISDGAKTDALNTGATILCGSDIALNGEVSLEGNTIDTGCNGATATIVGGLGPGTPTPTPTPEPGMFALFSSGLLALVFLTFRKSRVSLLI
jgi:hypothetical protein